MKGFSKITFVTFLALSLSVFSTRTQAATDNADDPAYNSGWDANSGNGGTGFQTWVGLETTQFGRGFLTTTRNIVGGKRFLTLFSSHFASNQVSATARPFTRSLSLGTATFLGRFGVRQF